MNLRRPLAVCLDREHLRRTGLIALVVGTWLTLFNQVDVLVTGRVDWGLLVQILLNYATPFAVSNAGLLARQEHD
jgi:hypothetical protein